MSIPDWRISDRDAETRITPEGVTEAAGATWSGRFERMSFGPGFHMHLGRLEIASATELQAQGVSGGLSTISAFTVIGGRGTLSLQGRPELKLGPRRAILLISQGKQGIFRLPGPQVLRFFSVAMAPELLVSLLDGQPSPELAAFIASRGQSTVVREARLSPALPGLIAKLGDPRRPGALQRLQREGVALQLLTELVQPATDAAAAAIPKVSAREASSIRVARKRLLADLRNPPTAAALAEAAGIKLRRFLRAFEAIHGASPAQLLRLERLERARQLLEREEASLKQVAWRVGYGHASNFVAAFSGHFGLPPRQFLRQGRA